jgi:hypothetical protein
MHTVSDDKAIGVPLNQFLIGGAWAGLTAAVINNIYSFIYTSVSGFSASGAVNIFTVTLASFIPLMLAALVYYLLATSTSKPTSYFVILSIILTMFSERLRVFAIYVYEYDVPVDFYGLVLPMNFMAGAIAAIVIPLYIVRKGWKKKAKEQEHA